MIYSYAEPPPKHNGLRWFGHEITMIIKRDRQAELEETLERIAGKKSRDWRLAGPAMAKPSWTFYWQEREITIRFAQKSTAVAFKLEWVECENSTDQLWQKFHSLHSIRPSGNSISPLMGSSRGIHPLSSGSGKSLLASKALNDLVLLDYESTLPYEKQWLKWAYKQPNYWDREHLGYMEHGVMDDEALRARLAAEPSTSPPKSIALGDEGNQGDSHL